MSVRCEAASKSKDINPRLSYSEAESERNCECYLTFSVAHVELMSSLRDEVFPRLVIVREHCLV